MTYSKRVPISQGGEVVRGEESSMVVAELLLSDMQLAFNF